MAIPTTAAAHWLLSSSTPTQVFTIRPPFCLGAHANTTRLVRHNSQCERAPYLHRRAWRNRKAVQRCYWTAVFRFFGQLWDTWVDIRDQHYKLHTPYVNKTAFDVIQSSKAGKWKEHWALYKWLVKVRGTDEATACRSWSASQEDVLKTLSDWNAPHLKLCSGYFGFDWECILSTQQNPNDESYVTCCLCTCGTIVVV